MQKSVIIVIMKRKRICLVTISPESEYTSRVIAGVLAQYKKYGYDTAVVSALVSVCNYNKNYLQGELNIYNLINDKELQNDLHSLADKLRAKIKTCDDMLKDLV